MKSVKLLNIIKEVRKALKEDESDDDILGAIDYGFDDESAKIAGDEKPTHILSPELKVAMVINNLSEYEHVLFNGYSKYSPMTLGAKANRETGTIFDKVPKEKLPDVEAEVKGLISRGRYPVSWGEDEKLRSAGVADFESAAKWQHSAKNRFIISFHKSSISGVGKEQIEFLARMLSQKPNTSPTDKIEEVLLNSAYKAAIINNSEAILRDFYYYSLIPIVMHLTKRQTYHSEDLQLEEYITTGIDKAIDATKAGMYNTAKGNYGAWLISVCKNFIINKIKKITDFKVDKTAAYEMLSNAPAPFVVQSKLDPEEAHGVFDDVKRSKYEGFWDYIYNDPMNVLADLERTAQKGDLEGKLMKNPLQARFLRRPDLFFKSVPKNMTGADIEHGGEYELDTEHILEVPKLPTEAKNEIYLILDKVIADTRANIAQYGAKNFISRMEKYKEGTKNLMFRLLQYGGMIPVYSKSVKLPDGVRGIGIPVVYNPRTGRPELTTDGIEPGNDNDLINYVWRVKREFETDKGLKTDFGQKFVDDMKTHNIPLPPEVAKFDKNNPTREMYDYVDGVYSIVKKYFGGVDATAGAIAPHREDLDKLLNNIAPALLAESKRLRRLNVKKIITNAIRETFKY